jgi:hypothetical protein
MIFPLQESNSNEPSGSSDHLKTTVHTSGSSSNCERA